MKKEIIWLRAETKSQERRTPLTPSDAEKIIACNHRVFIESSVTRIFKDYEYIKVGCLLVEPGSWINAPINAYILGIKELPSSELLLQHTHIYFAHAYKNQVGSKKLLNRFKEGNGKIYDLEFLQDDNGNRLTSFSYWAGVAGCAITLLLWIQKQKNNQLTIPEYYSGELALIQVLKNEFEKTTKPSSLVIGAGGKCAKGVAYFLDKVGLGITKWLRADTLDASGYPEILEHDLLFNCIYLTNKIPPFITKREIRVNKKLSIIADISCDPNGPFNPLPIYKKITTFKNPVIQVGESPHIIDIMAIDHLPTFLPKESSSDFSKQLTPYLIKLLADGSESKPWKISASFYYQALNKTSQYGPGKL